MIHCDILLTSEEKSCSPLSEVKVKDLNKVFTSLSYIIKIFVLFAEYIFKNSPNSFQVIIVKHKAFMTVDC